jgi:hypothetical protein
MTNSIMIGLIILKLQKKQAINLDQAIQRCSGG